MDARHRYTTPVGILPSVTTVLRRLDKPALLYWASKVQSEACEAIAIGWALNEDDAGLDVAVLEERLKASRQAHRDKSRTAADMGTEGHKLAECEFRRQLGMDVPAFELRYPQEAHAVFAGIMEWAKENDVQPVAMEQPTWHRSLDYAGTLDLAAYVRGTLKIVDFKSNDKGKCYPEAKLQNIALRGALKSHGLEAGGEIVVVPRDGQGDVVPIDVPWSEDAWFAFHGLLCVERWMRQEEKAK